MNTKDVIRSIRKLTTKATGESDSDVPRAAVDVLHRTVLELEALDAQILAKAAADRRDAFIAEAAKP